MAGPAAGRLSRPGNEAGFSDAPVANKAPPTVLARADEVIE
jgi:hypothetical protein